MIKNGECKRIWNTPLSIEDESENNLPPGIEKGSIKNTKVTSTLEEGRRVRWPKMTNEYAYPIRNFLKTTILQHSDVLKVMVL